MATINMAGGLTPSFDPIADFSRFGAYAGTPETEALLANERAQQARATEIAEQAKKRAGQARLGAGLALGATALDTATTPTENYYERFGFEMPSGDGLSGLAKDVGVRSLGALSDFGNAAAFGVPKMLGLYRDVPGIFSGAQAAEPAPSVQPVVSTPKPAPSEPYPGLGTIPLSAPSVPAPAVAPSRFPLSGGPTARVSAPSTIGSAQQTATAPAAPPGQQYPTFAESPDLKAARQKASESAGRIDSLFEKISEANKTPVPQGLSATDKWSLLAGALGTAAMVSAFPEYGVLAGIGAGLAVGSGGYNAIQARNVNAAEAERQRKLDTVKQQGALYKDQYERNRNEVGDMREFERGAFSDQLGAFKYANEQAQADRKFNEEVRQFGMNYALQNRRLAQQAASAAAARTSQYPVQGFTRPDGSIEYRQVTPGLQLPAGTRPLSTGKGAGALGVSYNPLAQINEIAATLDPKQYPTPEIRFRVATGLAAQAAGQFNSGVGGQPQGNMDMSDDDFAASY